MPCRIPPSRRDKVKQLKCSTHITRYVRSGAVFQKVSVIKVKHIVTHPGATYLKFH